MKQLVLALSTALLLIAGQAFAAASAELETGFAMALKSEPGRTLLRSVLRSDRALTGQQAAAELADLESLGKVTPSVATKVRTAMMMIYEQSKSGKSANEAVNAVLLRSNGSVKSAEQLPETSAATGAKIAATSMGLDAESRAAPSEANRVACETGAPLYPKLAAIMNPTIGQQFLRDIDIIKEKTGSYPVLGGDCSGGLLTYKELALDNLAGIVHKLVEMNKFDKDAWIQAFMAQMKSTLAKARSAVSSFFDTCHIGQPLFLTTSR